MQSPPGSVAHSGVESEEMEFIIVRDEFSDSDSEHTSSVINKSLPSLSSLDPSVSIGDRVLGCSGCPPFES